MRPLQLLIENISKRYKGSDSYALRDLTLDIGPGILGLLGPNGAGKSTLMRIIATITRPTHGTVRWNGVDIAQQPDEIRSVLGYLPQDFGVYPNLTADEFLQRLAVKGVPVPLPVMNGDTHCLWKELGSGTEFGIVAPLSHDICSRCSRVRLTASGELVTCLAGTVSIDLGALVREGACEDMLVHEIRKTISSKPARRSEYGRMEMWRTGG